MVVIWRSLVRYNWFALYDKATDIIFQMSKFLMQNVISNQWYDFNFNHNNLWNFDNWHCFCTCEFQTSCCVSEWNSFPVKRLIEIYLQNSLWLDPIMVCNDLHHTRTSVPLPWLFFYCSVTVWKSNNFPRILFAWTLIKISSRITFHFGSGTKNDEEVVEIPHCAEQ